MSVDTMAAEEDGRREGRKQGADRERRRIRKAQREALKTMRAAREKMPFGGMRIEMLQACYDIDAATRAKKGKRK